MCVDTRDVGFFCLNPENNQDAEMDFAVKVYSNLPFYKQFRITPLTWGEQPLPLYSYKPVDANQDNEISADEWVLVADPDGVGPDEIPVANQSVAVAEVDPDTGAVGEYIGLEDGDWIGPIGDKDHHEWVELIKWKVKVDTYCITAGYYTGQLCVDVYQN